MSVANFPFYCVASPAVEAILGRQREHVAVLALRALLRAGHGLEIAHQQVQYRGHDFAFASRVTRNGELVIEIDVGHPSRRDRVILEDDLRRAGRAARAVRR